MSMSEKPVTGELALIQWIREQVTSHPNVLLGIGDDTAALRWPDANDECLITTDMLLEGSCFLLESGLQSIGRKAMAVNISDIAAMAGQPIAAVVSVGLPRQGGRQLAEDLFLGMKEMAERFQVALVGGDTNTWNGPMVINVALIGRSTGTGSVKRSGASSGDWLMTTGSFGGSILGRHLDFAPRIPEAQILHQAVTLRAMIDVSDGLALDTHRLCEESGCGAVLRAERIPIHEDAHQMTDAESPLQHALSDGEDFELVFAVSPEDGQRLLQEQPLGAVPISHVGECVESGFWLEQDGERRELAPEGYVHEIQ